MAKYEEVRERTRMTDEETEKALDNKLHDYPPPKTREGIVDFILSICEVVRDAQQLKVLSDPDILVKAENQEIHSIKGTLVTWEQAYLKFAKLGFVKVEPKPQEKKP